MKGSEKSRQSLLDETYGRPEFIEQSGAAAAGEEDHPGGAGGFYRSDESGCVEMGKPAEYAGYYAAPEAGFLLWCDAG